MNLQELQNKYHSGEYKLKGEFQGSHYAREETLTRCERYAGWTIPGIFPDDPLMEYDELQHDYQSLGAQSVIHLANKMVAVMFPPSRPFFRLELTKEQREKIESEEGLSSSQIDKVLAEAEREATKLLVKKNIRAKAVQLAQELIITGNSLLQYPKSGKKVRTFSIRDYIIHRDLEGEAVKIIFRETKAAQNLSGDMYDLVVQSGYAEKDEVTLYTGICKVEDTYYVWQELEDLCRCSNTVGEYTEDTLEWLPQVWNLARDKDYGTGLVENYSGDFHSLSSYYEAMLDYATIVTDVKYLVNPQGVTPARKLQNAASGAFVEGREEDIHILQADVGSNIAFLREQISLLERRIGAGFLLNNAVTRDAERVTAEEIRRQALELEQSLGGVYSQLAMELQQPIALRLMSELDPVFKDVEPVITTGLESLSRNADLDKLREFFTDLIALADVPEEVAKRIDYTKLMQVLGAGHGVNYDKFMKTEEQVEEDEKKRIAQAAALEGSVEEAKTQGQSQG